MKLRVFVLEAATSGPHLTFSVNTIQYPGPDLPYSTVPGALHSDGKILTWS